MDADTSSSDISSSRTRHRQKREVPSEAPLGQEDTLGATDQIVARSDTQFPSLYALDDAASQYGTIRQRSARQLRGQTSNQPWPSDYEVVDTPYSSSNNYYHTNKNVPFHNRPSQNVPYIQYAEKSPHVPTKAKKSQNSDILPLLLNNYNTKNYQQQPVHPKQPPQRYLDDEENNLPDNFSYFHLGKGNSSPHNEKKPTQSKFNYVPNTTPKSSPFIAFSTVGGFYNNQPVTQSPAKQYLKQQYFTPSDGRWLSNTIGQGGAAASNGKPNQNGYQGQGQEETFYSYSFPSNGNSNGNSNSNQNRPVKIGNQAKHPQTQYQPQQEENFYPTHGYNKNPKPQSPSLFTNSQAPYVEEVEIKPKRPYESSTPKGQGSFFVTEKPRVVQIGGNSNKHKDNKPVYENAYVEYKKPSFSSGFDEFLAGIRNTNYQDIKPTYTKNLTIPTSSTQRPEFYNDDEYYYDEDYEEPPVVPQQPVKQHSSFVNENKNNNNYFYNTGVNYQNNPAQVKPEPINALFKIPIQQHGQLDSDTVIRNTHTPRPKPLTTSTVKYTTTKAPPSTTPYSVGNSEEYYYDDEDYDFKIPLNASKYMPMSETMAPRPTQPSHAQRPHSPYNKYNIHTSNYHYSSSGEQAQNGKYEVDTLDNVDDNGAGNDDEYSIDIRINNNKQGTRNHIQAPAVPSILQFPEDYFQGINLKPHHTNSSKQGGKIKTTELYTNPHINNYQPTYRAPTVSPTTVAPKIASTSPHYQRPHTASSTTATVTIRQRPTTTPTVTTHVPPTPTTRQVYTVRPSRVNQKWRPAKKNKNKTEQLELDERLPNR